MKRPLMIVAFCFSMGIVCGEKCYGIGVMVACIAVALCLLLSIFSCLISDKVNCFWNYFKRISGFCLFSFPMAFLVGLLVMQNACQQSQLQAWLNEQERAVDEIVEVEGIIQKIVWQEEKGSVWLKEVLVKLGDNELLSSDGVVLYLDELQWVEAEEALYPSQRVHVKGRLSSFSHATNPGQFDLQEYYEANHLEYGIQVKDIVWEQKTGFIWQKRLQNLKIRLHNSIEGATNESDSGIFQAIFLGESKAMNEDLKELYQKSGIAHILAVSGLHVSFLVLGFYQLVRKVSGSYGIGMLGGSIAGVLYGCLIGNPISAVRAIIMVLCQMLAAVLGRKYDLVSAASLALILLLLSYPKQLYQCGFLFSFLAVYGIGLFLPWFQKWVEKSIFSALVSGLCLQLVLLPVQAYFYYTWNIGGIFLNLAALPLAVYLLFSAMMTAVCGLFSTSLSIFFAGTGHYILLFYEYCCKFLEESPIREFVIGQPKPLQLVLYYGILCLAGTKMAQVIRKQEYEKRHKIERKNKPIVSYFLELPNIWNKKRTKLQVFECYLLKTASLGIVTLMMVWILLPVRAGRLQMTFLDVGQGDCIYTMTPSGNVMLVDGGSSSVSDVGMWRIQPFLLSQGVAKIDYMIMTHPDSDHYNGLKAILEDGTIQVKNFILTKAALQKEEGIQMKKLAELQGANIYYAEDGITLQEDEFFVTCIHPTQEKIYEDINDSSIVLDIYYGTFHALLTGDLGSGEEEKLDVADVWLLKAGHHGSQYSSSLDFLEQLEPKYTVISCGVNRYGHPSAETLKRLEEIHSNVKITREVGAIFVESDGENHNIKSWQEGYK